MGCGDDCVLKSRMRGKVGASVDGRGDCSRDRYVVAVVGTALVAGFGSAMRRTCMTFVLGRHIHLQEFLLGRSDCFRLSWRRWYLRVEWPTMEVESLLYERESVLMGARRDLSSLEGVHEAAPWFLQSVNSSVAVLVVCFE